MKKRKNTLLWLMTSAAIIILLLITGCYYAVVWNASGRTYDSVSDIPHNRVGLLLAASPITPGGAHNFYFENRIKSADELYKAGKVDYIIASGGVIHRLRRMGVMNQGRYAIHWLHAVCQQTG